MLKPDSTRYPSLVQPLNRGPQRIEPDPAEPRAESNDDALDEFPFLENESTPLELSEDTLSPEPDPEAAIVRRDYRTGALTAAVLALAVLLGWMVGRVGWSMAVNRAPTQIPMTPEEAQASAQLIPGTAPGSSSREEPVVPAPPAGSTPAPAISPRPAAKPKIEPAEPVGGLVIYERGKIVFRMAPSRSEPGGIAADAIQKAASRQDDAPAPPVAMSPRATRSDLLERVEPEYPEVARELRIQGPVLLNALVGTDGSVRKLTVISGDPQLVKAATDAVQQWRFKPREQDGRAVVFETEIRVDFELP